jgi:nickel-dependent lactate racemase
MKLEVPFGNRCETVVFPSGVRPDRIGRTAGNCIDEIGAMSVAIKRPLGCPVLPEFLRDADELLVVVNDGTRATPTGLVLETICALVPALPRVKIIVATGLHRAPTEDEYRHILGRMYDRFRPVTFAHDGNTLEKLQWVKNGKGQTLINPTLAEAGHILVINSVEPHFFAGFTGGRKSFLPGLAGYPSVETSHAGAVSEAAAPLKVEGNPVREFITAGTEFLDPSKIFAIQLVLDRFDKIVMAAAGNIDQAFTAACAEAAKFYTMPVSRRYDIVLAQVRPPLDLNLYQTEKAWEQAKYALKRGGILICVSACTQGIGSTFYKNLGEKYPDHTGWLGLADRPYEMGLHKLVRTARMWGRGELWLVSEIDAPSARTFRYTPKPSVQAAIDDAFRIKGHEASVLIIDDAALTVPIFAEQGNFT